MAVFPVEADFAIFHGELDFIAVVQVVRGGPCGLYRDPFEMPNPLKRLDHPFSLALSCPSYDKCMS